jgi:uncharacterized protein
MTKTERLLLMNQFRILAELIPAEADHCNKLIEVLEHGYTREYHMLTESFPEELSREISEEVVEILEMHRALHYGYTDLADKNGVNGDLIAFRGFDANEEVRHFGYASFLIRKLGYWQESANAGDGLNSHFPTLGTW